MPPSCPPAQWSINPDQFTIFNGIGVSIASSEKEALDRRARLEEMGDPASRRQYLGHMLGIPVAELPLDAPIPAALLQRARPSRQDQRAQYAYDLAMKGFVSPTLFLNTCQLASSTRRKPNPSAAATAVSNRPTTYLT